ncbi:MAG: recombinase family protein, partial [Chitinophagaceae bacterium]|nr:recombinase family protein [Chitinophagaceae bacterium]
MSKSLTTAMEQMLEAKTVLQYNPVSRRRGSSAVIYTRVSSLEQAQNNGSLEIQKKHCSEYALRNKIHVKEFFGGTYESAKTDGRKEFQRMLSYVKSDKAISYIIVFNLDRFSRTGSSAAKLSEDLSKQGIIIKSVTQEIDTSSASGRFQENFFHLINNFDNQLKSERTKINTREVMMKGYWPYTTPIGYENLNKKQRACYHKLVITDEGMEIKKAFHLKAEGKLSNVEIIEKLRAKGIRIGKSKFQWIITNPFYAGYVTGNLVNGKLIKGQHPPLVSLETFMKANEIIKRNNRIGVPKKSNHPEVPLKVFAKDAKSLLPFTGYEKNGYWYYKLKETAEPVNINARKLNDLFLKELAKF